VTNLFFASLETPRLSLRRFCGDDLSAFIAYRSQPETARYQSWEAPFPRARALAFLESLQAAHPGAPGQWFQFAVALKADGRLIGDVALKGPEPGGDGAMEIGYTLDARETGRGYASEAVSAVLDYAFVSHGAKAVEAWTDRRHVRSLALLARVGFSPLEVPPRLGVFKGETCEDLGHAMTAAAWRAMRELA